MQAKSEGEGRLNTARQSTDGMSPHTHIVLQQSLGDFLFHAFKELYVQSLARHQTNQAEASVATYDKKYKSYRISPEKPLNKKQQLTATTTNPGEGGI